MCCFGSLSLVSLSSGVYMGFKEYLIVMSFMLNDISWLSNVGSWYCSYNDNFTLASYS